MSQKATILLVEDEIFTRRMMQIYFENEGYLVEQAANGMEALTCLEEKHIDLVISDIMMPEISGLDLLQKIRERFSQEALPVIMVTGMDDGKQIVKAMELGANDFLTKTKEFRIVLSRVALHLEWKQLKHQVANGASPSPSRGGLEGTWIWNLEGGKVRFSKSWKHILGFESQQVEPSIDAWFDRVHPDDFARVSKSMGDHQKRLSESFQEDYRILSAEKKYLWVRSVGTALFDQNGKPKWMVGTLVRLSVDEGLQAKRKVLESQLRELKAALHGLSETLDVGAGAAQQLVLEKAASLSKSLESIP